MKKTICESWHTNDDRLLLRRIKEDEYQIPLYTMSRATMAELFTAIGNALDLPDAYSALVAAQTIADGDQSGLSTIITKDCE